jgi:phosphate transport system protein
MTLQSRAALDDGLAELNNNILTIASMVDEAIECSMEALYTRNAEMAGRVVANDEAINQLRYETEQTCLLLLATQQPVAGDLRTIVATIHIVSELERIGDHAAGIARLVGRLENEPELDTLHKLPKMAKRARTMLQESIQAFIEKDPDLAQSLVKRIDKLDKQYRKLFRETLDEMRDDEYIRRATFLLWVGHDLERIGDRATNISERVTFMTTGRFIETTHVTDYKDF